MGYSVVGRNSTTLCGGGPVARQGLSVVGDIDRVNVAPGATLKVTTS